MRTLDFTELARRSRAIDVWGGISKEVDTKPRNVEDRRTLVIIDAVAIRKSVDFSKYIRVSDGLPLGGKSYDKS